MTDLLYSDITYKIRGALFSVYNTLGAGHKEVIYQRSLASEFTTKNLAYKREPKLKVKYKGADVGIYIPDFLVEDEVIVELKSGEYFPPNLEKQLLNYLVATGYELAIAANFGPKKLQIIRKILTKQFAPSTSQSAPSKSV